MSRLKPNVDGPSQTYMAARPRSMSLSADWESVMGGGAREAVSRAILRPSGTTRGAMILERKEQITFCTRSKYEGQWSILNMDGFGNYTLPHGVEYEGFLRDGVWHGEGTLIYPTNAKIEGEWKNGKLGRRVYRAPDGLEIPEDDWDYCQSLDRRFYSEIMLGLRPAGLSQLTDDTPTRVIPDGCYDTGDGFYNPKSKCVVSAITGEVLRIPNKKEEEWIISNCRKAWDENVGFRPDLYECWFEDDVDKDTSEGMYKISEEAVGEQEDKFAEQEVGMMGARTSIYSVRQESWSRARSESVKIAMEKRQRVSVDSNWPSGMQLVLNIEKFYGKETQQSNEPQEEYPAQKFLMDYRSKLSREAARKHKFSRSEQISETELKPLTEEQKPQSPTLLHKQSQQTETSQEGRENKPITRIHRVSLLGVSAVRHIKGSLDRKSRDIFSRDSRTNRVSNQSELGRNNLNEQREKLSGRRESIERISQVSSEIQSSALKGSKDALVYKNRESPTDTQIRQIRKDSLKWQHSKSTDSHKGESQINKDAMNEYSATSLEFMTEFREENELEIVQTEGEAEQGRKQNQASDQLQRDGQKDQMKDGQPAPAQALED